MKDFEIAGRAEKNLALCAAIRAAFPDSVKEGFYREACAKNPANPIKEYCNGIFQDRHFFDDLIREAEADDNNAKH